MTLMADEVRRVQLAASINTASQRYLWPASVSSYGSFYFHNLASKYHDCKCILVRVVFCSFCQEPRTHVSVRLIKFYRTEPSLIMK